MSQSHFLEKYNKLLLLIKSNEDEEDLENQNSQTEFLNKPNYFDFDILKRKKNNNSKNFQMDFSIENINIKNVRDLIKNKNEFNKKIYDDFRIENNHSEILLNIDKFSYNNEDISMDAGDLLNEINFTESAASTYREKVDRKIGSVIKPTNTFNNRVTQDIEYQLDLEKAKRKQRNRENNFNNINCNRKLSAYNFGSSILNSNFDRSNFQNKFNSNNLTKIVPFSAKKEKLSNIPKNGDVDKNLNINLKLGDEDEMSENINELKNLHIDDLKEDNHNFNSIDENDQSNNIEIQADYSKGPNNININFTNYGVMNNNLINYQLPKMNSLNSKMLDLFREINSNKPKANYNSINNLDNLNLQTNKYNVNDLNKNKILESFNNNNLNNLHSNADFNFVNPNKIVNNPTNIRDLYSNNLFGSNNLANSNSKEDYFSELFKSVETKNSIKSLTDRINILKKKNNLVESNIKGVNNTNNLLNLNSKYSNLDKIFKNKTNINMMNPLNNKISNINNKKNQNSNTPLFSKPLMRNTNLLFETGNTNHNNFDLLEAQLDSLKKKNNKTKISFNKLNNLIIGENSSFNNIKNLDDKINKINYDKLNQSLEECENLINDLRDSKSSKRKNPNLMNNLFDTNNNDFDNI